MDIHILWVVLFDSDRNFYKYLFYTSLYYGGELAYYVFYRINFHSETSFTDIFYISIQNEWCYIDWRINNQAGRSNLSILTILMPVSRSVWIAKRLNWLKLLFITFSDDIFVSLRMDFITSILTTNWPVGRQYDSNQQVT